ncbi:Spy/CpxP family protein refolding chaperone [Neisseria wadsworthii]|uniref:Periplasmic protein n=1 Tax=Neisseria wadsworthii 9715 TaxID=1030841 RepID=G4CQV8_9NEIS|nr:Spy/CpxP family protein refolding chaperone [Neisseria wadsworthii]EGZ46104.1 hypothetical protein HMPREF9370_1468 [Neisseria wadsworthii 9715]QMT35192.1 Spy/CpxP family protein refolding chaperone [Neisseria wadsworthii]
MKFSSLSFIKYTAATALCTLSLHASAVVLSDFYPNCDMRSLSLDENQQKALLQIRNAHKKNIERVKIRNRSANFSRKQELIKVLSTVPFSKHEARRYLQKRYDSDMDLAVEELSVQHKIFQVLTPEQQEKWLANCAR